MLNSSDTSLAALDDSLRQDIAHELEHFAHADTHFFNAWKRAVLLAGPQYFGTGQRADADLALKKWDLCPRLDLIRRAIGVMSPAEQRFLAALTSFYNAEDGGRLLKRAGFHGFADLGNLDLKRRTILAVLLLSYNGW